MKIGIHPKDRLDAAIAIVLALTGLYFVWASSKLPAGPEPSVPGPAVAPGFLGVLLMICGLALVIRTFAYSRNQLLRPYIEIPENVWNFVGQIKPAIAIGLLIACALLLEPLGFMLCTFLFLLTGFIWLGEAGWRLALSAAALASGSLWLFFTKLLGVGLPYGLIVEVLFR